MEFDGNWLHALALFFFISVYHLRSATDKQQAGLVSVKSSFFFSPKSKLHQLSVMSCQESCSSKECIKAPVPTLHFTSQHDHCTTGVLSLTVFHFSHYSWQILNHTKNILDLYTVLYTFCGTYKIHKEVRMRGKLLRSGRTPAVRQALQEGMWL